MAVAFALAAALCNAVATIFERIGVESAPPEASMSWRLLAHIARRPIWFAGLGAMVGAFLLQAAALDRGGLSVVQPILVTELLFLVVILRVWFGRPLGWREATGSIGTVLGLAVFLAVSNQGGGSTVPSPGGWLLVFSATGAGVVLSLAVGRAGGRAWRAAWFGTAAGLAFALCASCIKASTSVLTSDGVGGLFTHFEPYGLAVTGAAGLFLAQNAFHAGPIAASQSTLLIVDPIASIVIGVGLFGDNLRGGPAALALDAVSLLVMSVGLFVLCTSPLVAATGGEEQLARIGPAGYLGASGAAGTSQ